MRLLHTGFPSPLASAAAIAALAVVGGVVMVDGAGLFSPGGLARPHADLEQCASCHAPPGSGQVMSDRCAACHDEIVAEVGSGQRLHGLLPDAGRCLGCHTEHGGAGGRLTAYERVHHDAFGFPLTGRHRQVACDGCHTGADFSDAPTACVGCHAEPDEHRGQFGTACDDCHSTESWSGARFDHSFPVDHGTGRRSTCRTCHPQDYRTYSCYGCHEHTPEGIRGEHLEEGIRDYHDCMRCHPTGREHEGRHGGEDGD